MLVVYPFLTIGCSLFMLQEAPSGQRYRFDLSPAQPRAQVRGPFEPVRAQREKRDIPAWVDFRGRAVHAPACNYPCAETVAKGEDIPIISVLPFRDPELFVAGELHNCHNEWDKILPKNEKGTEARGWILNGVDVADFFQSFKGKFRGHDYDSSRPPSLFQPNARNCEDHKEFVSSTLEDWVRAGAIKVIGKVGEVEPPWLIMPLTVEPSKPRLCHDGRFLNLWIKDSPFTLDTLADVPRIIQKDAFMTSIDHKSGYQHVRITEASQKYFGICWEGYYMVYCTLPFGFKASCFIYHTLASMVVSYGRDLGVPNLAYIDDSLNAQFVHGTEGTLSHGGGLGELSAALKAVYMMCDLLGRLGYTLSLSKSVMVPTQFLRFLGMITDSKLGGFVLPEDKKSLLCTVRNHT